MLESELIKRVAKELDITQGDIKIIIDKTFEIIKESILKRDTVVIKGFGRFKTIPCKPGYWMDMKTKERYIGNPKYKLKFIAIEDIRDEITKMKVDEIDLKSLYGKDYDDYKIQAKKAEEARKNSLNSKENLDEDFDDEEFAQFKPYGEE